MKHPRLSFQPFGDYMCHVRYESLRIVSRDIIIRKLKFLLLTAESTSSRGGDQDEEQRERGTDRQPGSDLNERQRTWTTAHGAC